MVWCFEDEHNSYAEWIFGLLDTVPRILVPSLWPIELSNALLTGERRKRLSSKDSAEFLSTIDKLPIEVDSRSSYHTMEDILQIGRASGLSAYDASYIELARRENLPLATVDEPLRKAAQRLGILEYRKACGKAPAA